MDMKCNIPLPPEKHGGLAGEKDEKGSNACGPVLGVRGIQGGMFELRSTAVNNKFFNGTQWNV